MTFNVQLLLSVFPFFNREGYIHVRKLAQSVKVYQFCREGKISLQKASPSPETEN